MRGKGLIAAIAVAGVTVALAACGGGGSGGSANTSGNTTSGTATKGGTYRMATQDFGFTGAFDPSAEYLGWAFTLYGNLLIRTLLSYNHTAGAAGNVLVPDLATAVPTPTNNGLTYTFKLKPGVKFGPPVNRAITSKDIEFAMERIATPSVAAQYGFYYQPVIKGMAEFLAGKAKTISGIQTPDDQTIVFNLTRPTGDFLNLMAMPASGPIPPEVGKCFTQAGAYGRDVIASGPYMIQGSDKVNIASCSAIKPMSGYNPTQRLAFVRNPNYDPATDSTKVRQALPDGFVITIDTNAKDIFDKIGAGALEGSPDDPPADIIAQYASNSSKKQFLKTNSADRTDFIYLNTTTPPFDDIHVRKAANFVMDKAALKLAWGGNIEGPVANHIVPDVMYKGGQFDPGDYNPYPSTNSAGDVNAAKNEMKQSKYDANKDGICDSSVCKSIFFMNRSVQAYPKMTPIIQSSLAKIGITLNPRELPTSPAYTQIQTPSKHIPIGANAGWGKDYPDPSTFLRTLFLGSNILSSGNTNYSLIGLTSAKAKQIGALFPATGVPNVDADIDKCTAQTGDARNSCWIALDKKLMETVVPWVPYQFRNNVDLIGPAVTQYDFDQSTGETGYAHVAVDQSKQSQ